MPTDQQINVINVEIEEKERNEFIINEAYVILWNINGKLAWFIGYVKEMLSNSKYRVEHLERVKYDSNIYWRYPMTASYFCERLLP